MQEKRTKKILVIEDEETVAELVKLKLERSGFSVYIAGDGLKGLDLTSKINPDLIVLDIVMPKMDGYQFLKELRKNAHTSDIPVLIMTARGAMKDTFENIGVSGFLVKPFEPEELLFRVKKILEDLPKDDQPEKKALIAGSDEFRVKMMSDQLKEKGYQVDIALDGHQALGKALHIFPNLFIVQFDIYNMNADEIVRVLDSYPGADKISVVVYSVAISEDDIKNSPWGQFLNSDTKKKIRNKESPLRVINTFDAKSFLGKIKDFL